MDNPIARLVEEIRTFRPGDKRERAHQSAILGLLQQPGFASRRNFRPGHIVASAFIIEPAAERLLLHYHRHLGKWLQMGGHLDEGETPRMAALREAMEESGLSDLRFVADQVVDLDVHEIPSSEREPAHLHFDLRYLLSTDKPSEITCSEQESLSLGWYRLEEAIALMAEPGAARAVRKIRKILAYGMECGGPAAAFGE